jgi:hypothetical protein
MQFPNFAFEFDYHPVGIFFGDLVVPPLEIHGEKMHIQHIGCRQSQAEKERKEKNG